MRLLHVHFKNQNRTLKGAGAKRDVCCGSSVSTGQSSRLPSGVGAYIISSIVILCRL